MWILTNTNRMFSYDDIEGSDVNIVDIAHALGNQCRFAGHTNRFYSVAEHSVLVSTLLPPRLALQGLMHDAHEAYMTDVPTPMKLALPDYKELEIRVERALRLKFGLPAEFDQQIKDADTEALWIERNQLLPPNSAWEYDGSSIVRMRALDCFPPHIAKTVFLQRYYDLIKATTGAPNPQDGVRVPGGSPNA